MNAAAAIANWSCQRCTLLNNIQSDKCKACDYANPITGKRESSFKSKFKIPTLSFATAIEKLDSALDLVSTQLYSPRSSGSNVGIPIAYSLETSSWQCPTCLQMNQENQHSAVCSWCNFNRSKDISYLTWVCVKCGLKQPAPPLNFKCPLCRSKTVKMPNRAVSVSMPQLDQLQLNQITSPSTSFTNSYPVTENPAENTRIFNEIVSFCKANHQSFVDDGFPHSNRSIGSMSLLERSDLSIIWIRPQQIITRDGRFFRWSVFNDPQPTDIEQGALGNCWFLSALAVVAERPDVLEKILITKEYNYHGVYEIRLCVDGVWQAVVVDDFFPCHQKSKTMVFAVGRKNQLWVSLIEKALAKIYGNYALLRAGRTVEGLSTLTGAPSQFIDLEQDLDPQRDKNVSSAALDVIWVQLLSAREAGFLMGCSCGAGKRHADEDEYKKVGLMTRHAYSILDVRQLDNNRLLRLRNPWGSFVWLGEWSRNWSGWTPHFKHRLGSDSSQPGTFWIPFERFVQYFDSVDIAQIREHSGWSDTRYLIDIGWDQNKCRLVKMTITEPTEICLTVYQRNARTVLDQVDIMVLIHEEDSSAPLSPAELVAHSPRRIQPSVRTDDVFLLPGEYLICVLSFSKFADSKTIPGTVVLHSSKKVFTELIHTSLDAFQKSMMILILKEGNMEELMSGCVIRYLTHDFAGLALMVDNMNKNCCLQVHSDCQNSTNVLSTRCSLTAADSIPPLHRQIVTVLTHFEPSQAYVVGHRLIQRLTTFAQLRDYAPPALKDVQNFPLFLTQLRQHCMLLNHCICKQLLVKMTITEPTEICLTVYQRNARTVLDQVDIMVLIHEEDSSAPLSPAELVAHSPRRIQPSVRTDDVFLLPGEYLICVLSFSKFADSKTIPGTVVLHSSKKVFTELIHTSLDAFQKSMMILILKEGNMEELMSGCVIRYLTHDFAGLALMVDNMNKNCCLQVHSDCQNSTNVLSTRCSLTAADSIPPLHRQIVTVLTHFEPSQAYVVGHRLIQRLTTFAQLRDYAPPALKDVQNFPLFSNPTTAALHAPKPLYL